MNNKRRGKYNINALILCGLVFFVIAATSFCMVVNSREDAAERARIEAQKKEEEERKKAEEEAIAAAIRAEEERAASFTVQPGVSVGTLEENPDEKVVYLTFDDGPSSNTEKVLDILDQYNAKATFFVIGKNTENYREMIKKAYDAGHTIGLHSGSHEYSQVYSSVDAYFEDLEEIGKIVEEQIGFVPCFIRFPGGASNTVSRKYSPGIMSQLVNQVQERGYQYYDWNISSGDGSSDTTKEEIISNSETDEYSHVMLLFHDSASKDATVEALPHILGYYQSLGYEFRAIDRESYVVHHGTNN